MNERLQMRGGSDDDDASEDDDDAITAHDVEGRQQSEKNKTLRMSLFYQLPLVPSLLSRFTVPVLKQTV